MMHLDKPIKSRLYLWILLFSFILPLAALNAEQIDAQRWKVNVGATETITGPDGACRKVTNNSASDIFVPIKTAAEWQAFLGHLPPGVTLSACIYCGDGVCNGAESCSSCPQDCGSCCGDSVCGNGESCSNCRADCGRCPTNCVTPSVSHGQGGYWSHGCTGSFSSIHIPYADYETTIRACQAWCGPIGANYCFTHMAEAGYECFACDDGYYNAPGSNYTNACSPI